MDLSRPEIDSILNSTEAQIAGAPEGDEHDAYFLCSQIFFDLVLADEDTLYVAGRLAKLRANYELAHLSDREDF